MAAERTEFTGEVNDTRDRDLSDPIFTLCISSNSRMDI